VAAAAAVRARAKILVEGKRTGEMGMVVAP